MNITRKDTLGFVIPFQGMYSYSEILYGASSVAKSLGYRIQVIYGAGDELHQFFDKERIAAWTVINSIDGNRWLDQLDESLPQLIISPEQEDSHRSIIIPDNVGGSRMAVDHLIGHGHERIVFIGSLKHADIVGRYRGYQQALKQASLPIDPQLTVNITQEPFWSRHSADVALTAFLNTGVAFTAIFAATDELALGVMTALERARLHIPDPIALVSFDDSPPAATSRPPLTSVRQSFVELGQTAARVMIDMIQGSITGRHTYEALAHVITRISCGCLPHYLQDDLLLAADEQIDIQDRLIIRMAETLVTGADIPTSQVYPSIRQLYHGFGEALVSYDLRKWSAILEDTLPEFLSRSELVNNLPHVIKLLDYDTHIAQAAGLTPQEITLRSNHLRAVAERAAVFFGILGNQIQNSRWFDLSNTIQRIIRTMASLDYQQLISLDWLQSSNVQFAALFLLDRQAKTMHLRGVFQAMGATNHTIAEQTAVTLIPPPGMVNGSDVAMAMIHTLEFNAVVHGALYVIPEQNSSILTNTYYGLWVEQLAALLSRFELEDDLRQNNASLRQLHDQERALSGIVRDLSAPVVPITEGIVVLPLIGIIDDMRAEQIIQNLLESVNLHNADVIVLDITGVPIVDTQTASYLLRATQAVRLLGAKVVLTGIRPEIAQTIVHLGIDTSQIMTAANMEAGLRYALGLRGLQISSIVKTERRRL